MNNRSSNKGSRRTSVGECLTGPSWQNLRQRASALQRLQDVLWPVLPETLQSQCQLVNISDGSITCLAGSPVWASQLRQFGPSLLRQAAVNGLTLARVVVRVGPLAVPPAKPPGLSKPLDSASRAHLAAVAADLPDEELKAILLRMAGTSDGSDNT